ncbi:UNVERIFIED_CONTAM: hypothetical protein K2H54_063910 [Gekko kuhli]
MLGDQLEFSGAMNGGWQLEQGPRLHGCVHTEAGLQTTARRFHVGVTSNFSPNLALPLPPHSCSAPALFPISGAPAGLPAAQIHLSPASGARVPGKREPCQARKLPTYALSPRQVYAALVTMVEVRGTDCSMIQRLLPQRNDCSVGSDGS